VELKRSAASQEERSGSAPKSSRRSVVDGVSPRRQLFEVELEETAARLFAQRGYAGTALSDIADELGMSRSSLYNYVKSKEELLRRLAVQFLEADAHSVQDLLNRKDLGPADKLEQMVKQIVVGLAARPALSTLFEYHRDTLPDEFRLPVAKLRRDITQQLVQVLQEGIRDGSFVIDDEYIAALVIGNIAVGSTRWLRPDADIETIAGKVARMAVRSLQAGGKTTGSTPAGIITQLHADIDRLGRFLSVDGQA
jgi:AcrR family transcriptional regulator